MTGGLPISGPVAGPRAAPQGSFFVTGGTMRPGAPSYVERRADRELLDALKRSEFCYVLDTRQMGKSSLMARAASLLRREGKVAVVAIDLTAFGLGLPLDKWYDAQITAIGRQLDLEDEVETFIEEHEHLGPLERWMKAIREVFVEGAGKPVVIFVDEIDYVRSLPFPTDEYFAGIRHFYNARALDPECERVTFCLLGVSTPSDLIRAEEVTPFNLGRRIVIQDFDFEDAEVLMQGLDSDPETAKAILKRIFYWTDGHPYLTQRLCEAVAASFSPHVSEVDRACRELFLAPGAREQNDNLRFVASRLLIPGSEADTLALYTKVRSGETVLDDGKEPFAERLRLSGIAKAVDGRFRVRNEIYARVFDQKWINDNMPDQESRRLRDVARRTRNRTIYYGLLILVAIAAIATAIYLSQEAREFKKQTAIQQGLIQEIRTAESKAREQKDEAVRLKDAAEKATREAKQAAEREAGLRERAEHAEQSAKAETKRANEETTKAQAAAKDADSARAKATESANQADKLRREADEARGNLQKSVADLTDKNVQYLKQGAALAQQKALADALLLTNNSEMLRITQPLSMDLSALLAIQAAESNPIPQTYQALRNVGSLLPKIDRSIALAGSGPLQGHAVSGNGRYVAVALKSGVCLADLNDPAPARCAPAGSPGRIAVSNDGSVIAAFRNFINRLDVLRGTSTTIGTLVEEVASDNGSVVTPGLCMTATGTVDGDSVRVSNFCDGTSFLLHKTKARIHIPLGFDAAGSILVTGSDRPGNSAFVTMWRLDQKKPAAERVLTGGCSNRVFSPDASQLHCNTGVNDRLMFVDGSGRADVDFPDAATRIAFSANSHLLARASRAGVQIWNDRRSPVPLPVGEGVTALEFNPSSDLLLISSAAGGHSVARVFDLSGVELSRISIPPGSQAFFAGARVAVALPNQEVKLFASRAGLMRPAATAALQPGAILHATADGKYLISASPRPPGRIRIFDLSVPQAPAIVDALQPVSAALDSFTEDGLSLLTGTAAQAYTVVSALNGEIVRTLPFFSTILASRAGYLATRPSDCDIRGARCVAVVDLKTGARTQLPVDAAAAAFDPEKPRIYTLTSSGNAQAWDWSEPERPLFSQRMAPARASASGAAPPYIRFSANGSMAVASFGGEIFFWDTGTQRVRQVPGTLPPNLLLSRNGRILARMESNRLSILSTGTGQPLCPPVNSEKQNLLFNHAGNRIAVWSQAGADVVSVNECTVKSVNLPGTVLGFNYDDTKLAVYDRGAVKWYRTDTWEDAGGTIAIPGQASMPRLSPDGRRLAVANWTGSSGSGTVPRILALDSLDSISRPGAPTAPPTSLAIGSSPEPLLAYGGSDAAVHLFSLTQELTKIPAMEHGTAVTSLAISPDGSLVAASGGHRVSLFQASNGARLGQLQLPGLIAGLAFSSANSSFLAVTEEGAHYVLSAPKLAVARQFGQTESINSVAVSPDHAVAISAGPKGIKLLDTGSWSVRAAIAEALADIRFSPDGKRFAARIAPNILKIWSADGTALGQISPSYEIVSFAFAPEDDVLGTASTGAADLWRLNPLAEWPRVQPIGTIPFPQTIAEIAFRPKSGDLILGARNGASMVTPWRRADLIKAACGSILRPAAPDRSPTLLTDGELDTYLLKGSYQDYCAKIGR